MATVVIIHAAEDTLPARALAEKLRQAKLQVELEKGAGQEVRDAVKNAPVTIALWSPRATEQTTLVEDVAFARGKSAVFHARMQSAALPQQFASDKAVNLTGWRGEDDFAAWRELAQMVASKAGVGPLPPPAPKPASGFFQPGRPEGAPAPRPQAPPPRPAAAPRTQAAAPPPPPRPQPQRPAPTPSPARAPSPPPAPEPEAKSGGGLMLVLIAIVVLAIGGGGAYWFLNQSGGQSVTAWEDVERNDASALRAFLAGNPGADRAEAEAALAELEERSYEAASEADSIEALEGFLAEFPESEYAIAARGRIAELQTLTPAATLPEDAAAPLPEDAAPADPDLLPPGASTAPPADSSGPAPLTPPPAEEPALTEPETAPSN
ncbi:MAG: hypothetical protein AB7O98_01460 [Hyphomonadaceae bacterium]